MNLVLCYHHVSPRRTLHNTSPTLLERHLEIFRNAGYAFLSHSEFLSRARHGFRSRARTALVTFDDGHDDNWFHARPLLASLNVPAVLFVISHPLATPEGNVRSMQEEPQLKGGPEVEDERSPMHWGEIEAWQRTGLLSVQSHTHRHRPLQELGASSAEQRRAVSEDLRLSRELIERQLGRAPTSLAWPWGNSNRVMRSVAAEVGFTLQFSTVPGYNGPWSGQQRLHRVCLDGASPATVEGWAQPSGARRATRIYSLARTGITAVKGHVKALQGRSFGIAR